MLFCVPFWAVLGGLPDSCGSPLKIPALFRAIVIIPNLAVMFNENRTFFLKKVLYFGINFTQVR
jgi:hypothetical protein